MSPRSAANLSPVRIAVIDGVRSGHRTVNALAALLAVTDNAVRLQLTALERDGLLRKRGLLHSGKSGQPAAEYELTEQGEDALSHAYKPALTALVSALRARLPARTLRAVFADVGRRMAHGERLPPSASFATRASACSTLLQSLGGSASVTLGRSHATLQGNSCPLAAAVRAEPETCFLVESLLEQHTGVKAVQRCEHGPHPRCCFELKPQ